MVKDPTAASKEQRIDFSAVFYAASPHPEGKGGFAGSDPNGSNGSKPGGSALCWTVAYSHEG